ncbi:MAG TPA: IS256 family transposase [Anaeromyxobacteraceae bacterium]
MIAADGALDKGLEGSDGDFLREGLQGFVQRLIEAEVAEVIGAGRYERTVDRQTYRNGSRERKWQTRLGELALHIPKLREGGYFPSFIEPRRRAEKALVSVVQEAYVSGVSTRKVDELVEVMGGTGMSKSTVSRLCKELDEEAEAFRTRPLEGEVPYLWLDALYEKVREGNRVRSMAVVLAIGVTAEGTRTVVGIDVGNTEDEAFWKAFLRSLVRRGLSGVQLVISDAHAGLKKAIGQVLVGASWQRCRVHAMRNLLTAVPRGQQAMVMAMVRTIFAQPTQREAKEQLAQVARALKKSVPRAAALLEEMAEEVLAYMAFPAEHWRQIHSNNPLERQNKEVRRRTRVVGIFPNRASLLRLVSLMLAEQDDEWQAAEKAYMSRRTMARITTAVTEPPALLKEAATA